MRPHSLFSDSWQLPGHKMPDVEAPESPATSAPCPGPQEAFATVELAWSDLSVISVK